MEQVGYALAGAVATYSAKSALFTAGLADSGTFFDNTGSYTISLTAAATLGAGWSCWIRNVSGTQVIDPNGSELINGASTYSVSNAGDVVLVECTGTAFVVSHSQRPSTVAITGGTINGTAIGGSTPAAGAFTTISATGDTTLSGHLALGNTTAIDATIVALFKDTYSGAGATYRGLRIETTHTGAAASASTGIDVVHATSGSNNMGHIVGNQVRPTHNGTGTLTGATGVFSQINAGASSGAITDVKLFWASAGGFAGTAPVNYYGLYIDTITGGSSLNYAIYTNGGTVRLGGPVVGVDTFTTSGLVTLTNATEATAVGTASTVLTGGLSVAKNCYIGGQLRVTGDTLKIGARDVLYSDASNTIYYAGSSGMIFASSNGGSNYLTLSSSRLDILSGIALRLGNAAVAATPTATHTLTVQDSGGTTYRLLCVV